MASEQTIFRREKLLRVFGADTIDRLALGLVRRRGVSALNKGAVDELVKLAISDFRLTRRSKARSRAEYQRAQADRSEGCA
jgi:hypothetical protein